MGNRPGTCFTSECGVCTAPGIDRGEVCGGPPLDKGLALTLATPRQDEAHSPEGSAAFVSAVVCGPSAPPWEEHERPALKRLRVENSVEVKTMTREYAGDEVALEGTRGVRPIPQPLLRATMGDELFLPVSRSSSGESNASISTSACEGGYETQSTTTSCSAFATTAFGGLILREGSELSRSSTSCVGGASRVSSSGYTGGFDHQGCRDGDGVLVWQDGRRYSGQFSHGLFEGRAVMAWPDGRRYVGQYARNMKNGDGLFSWPDGRRYCGQWCNGKRQGRGVYTNAKGQARAGVWEKDRPISWDAPEHAVSAAATSRDDDLKEPISSGELRDVEAFDMQRRAALGGC